MTQGHEWFHAKHDCLLARFSGDTDAAQQRLMLPVGRERPKAVVQTAFDGARWWCNGHVWTEADNAHELAGLADARVLVNSAQERLALHRLLGNTVDCVVFDDWFEDAAPSD